MNYNHPFHLVSFSPWPLLGSLGTLNLTMSVALWFNGESVLTLILVSMTIIILVKFQWWRDVVREGTYEGLHTNEVTQGLKLGMILFIVSEIFFFVSFFWAYFHSSVAPSISIGNMWPCLGIYKFNPMGIPLLNTIILLSSGITVTWAHHSIMLGKLNQSIQSLALTCILGVYFTYMQMLEYIEAPFTISDSVYGSTFFMATGFHGIHVMIGTIFLMVSLYRIKKKQVSSFHHFGFEAAAWYWHFVDVVWLFLYLSIYWWGT